MPINFRKFCDLVFLLLIASFIFLLLQADKEGTGENISFLPENQKGSQVAEDFTLHLKLAQALSEKEPMWGEAEKEFRLSSILKSRDYQPYLGLARLAQKKDNWTEAAKNYRQTVELNPDLVDSHTSSYLGKELIAFTKEALRRFKEKERDLPDDPINLNNLKNAYFLKRKLAGGCE